MKRKKKEQLPDDIDALKKIVLAQQDTLDKRQDRIQLLEEKFSDQNLTIIEYLTLE
ncbi:MAG: hypothetical protein V7784_23335 [Oceanospirillaceae bacterium]